MHALQVTDVAAVIVPAGNRDFVHIRNFDDVDDIYVKYDGSATALTSANGLNVPPGGMLALDNDGSRNIFKHPISAICGAGKTAEVRIQGALEP